MRKPGLYKLFLIFTMLCTLAAIITLIPSPHDPETNFLGYKSMCSFTPWSTLICLAVAGASCKIRKTFFR